MLVAPPNLAVTRTVLPFFGVDEYLAEEGESFSPVIIIVCARGLEEDVTYSVAPPGVPLNFAAKFFLPVAVN